MATQLESAGRILSSDEDRFVRMAVREPSVSDSDIVYSVVLSRVDRRYGPSTLPIQVLAQMQQVRSQVERIRQGLA